MNGNGNALSPTGGVAHPSPLQLMRGEGSGSMQPSSPTLGGPAAAKPGVGPGLRPPGMPQAGRGGIAARLGMGGPKLGPFAQAHEDARQAAEQYKTNMKAHNLMDDLRIELDDLMSKGDMVRPEDVIQATGRIMGHESGAFGAEDMARFLMDMPTIGGQGLATWIRMHDVNVRQLEARLVQDTNFKQHRMGVTAIKSMAASTLQQEAEQRRQAGLPGLPSPPQMGQGGMGMGMPPSPGGGGAMAPPTNAAGGGSGEETG